MPTADFYLERIGAELAGARAARAAGNDGRARVCARRAAGAALSWYAALHPRPDWGADAMRQLRAAALEPAFPPALRAAAARLSAPISGEFAYAAGADAEADARTIIDHVRTLCGGPDGAP